ncbi:MAG: site-specific integrase [Candidatus Acidiferrales bacterium]
MSEQQKRGSWKKDRADRGVYLRGKTWYVRYRDQHGRLRAERVGPSKALAIKVYQKRRTEVAERRFFPSGSTTFDELIKDAIAEAKRRHQLKKSKKQLGVYRYNALADWFKGRKAASITPQEIDRKLSEHCRTPANYNRYKCSLSHAYRLGIESGKVSENPARSIKLREENNTRVRFLEPKEEMALRRVIRKLYPEREAEFDLALNSGLRWAEQYELAWRHVDLYRSKITLTHTKSGYRQYVPINSAARAALETLNRLTKGSEFVCLTQDHFTFRRWWEEVVKESGVKDFHWHDLRHTFASRLVMNGVDIYTVSKLLRHGNVATSQRYAHLSDTHLQDAVERLAGVTVGDTVPENPTQTTAQTIQ